MKTRGIYFDDGGTGGTPYVFIHSAAGSSEHYRAQLEHLRKKRRAVALDLRGHGQSDVPENSDYSIEGMAEDIAAVVDHLGFSRFILAGHSMGALVAVAYAGKNPDRIAGLLLLDPASDGRKIPKDEAQGLLTTLESEAYEKTILDYWSSMLTVSSPEVRDFILTGLKATPRSSVIETLRAMLTFDPLTPLEKYRGPKLSLITDFNELPSSLHRCVSSLPHKKVMGTGHWLHLDRPEEVNTIIDQLGW
jgi:pimeloyl-ACP methyl ester carboxylesterase